MSYEDFLGEEQEMERSEGVILPFPLREKIDYSCCEEKKTSPLPQAEIAESVHPTYGLDLSLHEFMLVHEAI